ncbi:hypothetical protein PLICRDRAFT_103681 [Plicaturopsis crispa FD-325 SS-3]|nr:hypothetical protein PLICRDRAFT_103681 [Plicaturopsis crispa FD-325 SS-3]
METSTRKPPMSIRAKRFAKDIPSTPAPVPSQIRGWNTGDAGAAGPSKPLPAGPRFDHIARSSPKATRHASKAVAENPRTMLPGFVNAFASSSPVRLRSSRSMKGKGREIPEDEGDDIFGRSGRLSPPSMFQSQFNNSGPPPISPPSSPTRPLPQNNDVDVQMVSEPPWENDAGLATDPGGRDNADIQMVDESDEALLDAYDEVEPMNWREQLHQIILTHAVPSSSSSTFHSLLRVPLPASLPFSSAEAYTTACSRVLEIIASSRHKTWDAATQVVSESLTQMASILNAGNLITPLIALINVSSTLVLTLPLFSTSFLTPPDGMGEDALPRILEVTFDVIRDRISPANIDKAPLDEKPGLLSLAQETVGLLEALTWDAPDELEGSLALIPRTQGILSVLLAEAQPIELLDRSVRLLVFLASRPQLFRHLLSFPGPDMPDPDYARIPHIERLCLLLVDPNHQGREAESMRTSILVLFAALSTAHADARTILLESQLLIPTLVFYLTHLVSPLWEDDETLMASPTSVSPLVRHLNQTLFLFYHLVIGAETVNLRQKLVHGRHRAFIGIMHMFTVTFGRLSLAEPPDWIASEDRSELEQMTDMARQLLELVVDGPEYDGVWATFQDDPDQDSATDDEEMEARRLETNEI